ncbi:MAG: pyridoxine 5'-phosphate synthase [Myxococcota bacterium]|jgi:pyridoxine 5-phosphate synthase|nr:pyridoxine 5'-phosphate synthase [Myxococcota bacterium]
MTRLHVNVDHVATLRQARGSQYPDPIPAATICEMAGASGITIHLREDRRHIIDRDLELMRKVVTTTLNLEMAATDEMVHIARAVRPDICTLVPEKRQERTTEGGLDVAQGFDFVSIAVAALREAGIRVSLFIDPDIDQIEASRRCGADMVELHTGDYCDAPYSHKDTEMHRLIEAAKVASGLGLRVAAGHGLHYHNVRPVALIPEVEELNIGHSIISRAVFVGLDAAVRQMLEAMAER